jgi:hypothetical protein
MLASAATVLALLPFEVAAQVVVLANASGGVIIDPPPADLGPAGPGTISVNRPLQV